MRTHLAEIAAIGADPAPPSFANTIEAMERSGRGARAGSAAVFSNLVVEPGRRGAARRSTREMSPKLAQHGMRVSLDPALFARVDALHAARDELGLDEDQMPAARTHASRLRAQRRRACGAADKARMTEISERLAVLHTQFGQNVLHDEKAWHLPLAEADLDGLPDFVRAERRAGGRRARARRATSSRCRAR